MIKSLLDADDEPFIAALPEKIAVEEKEVEPPARENFADDDGLIKTENPVREVFEIPGGAKFFTPLPEQSVETPEIAPPVVQIDKPAEINAQVGNAPEVRENPPVQTSNPEKTAAEILNEKEVKDVKDEKAAPPVETPFAQSVYKSETPDETVRKSGMAYSAAVVLLVSIVFMMLLGWFADLLFGTKPWGIVGGVILGSILGFIQFFRITSSILK